MDEKTKEKIELIKKMGTSNQEDIEEENKIEDDSDNQEDIEEEDKIEDDSDNQEDTEEEDRIEDDSDNQEDDSVNQKNTEQEEILKKTEKKPSVKINKKIITIVISFLVSLIAFAFINSILKKNNGPKEKKKVAVATSKPMSLGYTIGVQDLGLDNPDNENVNINKDLEEKVTYGNVQNSTENKNIDNKTEVEKLLKDEKIQNEEIDRIIGKNIQLEEYYTRLVDSELGARNSDIEYSNYNRKTEEKEKMEEKKTSKEYNSKQVTDPLYANEIKAGSIIPGIMLTGINSDLGGNMIGIVRENVYDSITGNYILIPRGTKIIGKYDNAIGFGQERLLVVWERLIFPNGKSLLLDQFKGTDLSGNIGMTGKVDNHTIKLLQSVVLSSLLGGATALVKRDDDDEITVAEAIAKAGGERILDIGEMLAERILNVKPTIVIKPGARFNIIVTADLVLDPYNQN